MNMGCFEIVPYVWFANKFSRGVPVVLIALVGSKLKEVTFEAPHDPKGQPFFRLV